MEAGRESAVREILQVKHLPPLSTTAAKLLEATSDAVNNLDVLHQDGAVNLTVSIGVAALCGVGDMELQDQLDRLDLLYHQADCAVDHCKQQGGNQCFFYAPVLELSASGELEG